MTWTLFFPCRMGSAWRHRGAWLPSSWPSSAPCPAMYVDGEQGGEEPCRSTLQLLSTPSSRDRQREQLQPWTHVLCLFQVAIPQQEWLLRELLALSCSCNCPFTATTAAKCFAGLVNKHPEG